MKQINSPKHIYRASGNLKNGDEVSKLSEYEDVAVKLLVDQYPNIMNLQCDQYVLYVGGQRIRNEIKKRLDFVCSFHADSEEEGIFYDGQEVALKNLLEWFDKNED